MAYMLLIVLHDQLTFPRNRRQHCLRIRTAEVISWRAATLRYSCAVQDGTLQGSW